MSTKDYRIFLLEEHKKISGYLDQEFFSYLDLLDEREYHSSDEKEFLKTFVCEIIKKFGKSQVDISNSFEKDDHSFVSLKTERLNFLLREFSKKNLVEPPIQVFYHHLTPEGLKKRPQCHLACSYSKEISTVKGSKKIYSVDIIPLEQARIRKTNLQNTTQKQILHQNKTLESGWLQLLKDMSELGNASVYGEGMLKDLFVEPFLTATFPRKDMKSDTLRGPAMEMLTKLSMLDFPGHLSEPILLFGEFGSGKSSLLKMFAGELARDENAPCPIYIPLSEILIYSTSSLIDALKKYLKFKYHINDLDESISNRFLFWLFDGFDELNLYNKEDETWIIDRYLELGQIAKSNRVIVSSRPIMFLGNLDNIPLSTPRINIEPFSDNLIKSWILYWKKLPKYEKSVISLKGLRKRELIDVARNPMILFMIATMFDKELSEERPYLRSEIYKYFIDSTEKGKYIKDKDVKYKKRTPSNYREILQEIAFLIFRYSSSGFISKEELTKRLPETNTVEKVINNQKIRSILVGHFFQEITGNDKRKYVEFSHQSFREYLVVEKFLQMLIHATEKNYDAHAWHKLCCKMLTSTKMGFLCECICLLNGSMRKKIFKAAQRFLTDPGGIEKQFIPSNLVNSEYDLELFKSLNFTSTLRKILLAYICSVIASYASHKFRKELLFDSTKLFIIGIFHACNVYSLNSSLDQAWQLFLNELPGAVWGPNFDWNGFEINNKHFHDIAIISPKAKNVTINSEFISLIFCDLKDHTILNLGGKNIGRSIFRGGTIVLSNCQSGFNKCIFLNCQIINVNKKHEIDFEDCYFKDTSLVNISVTDCTPSNITQISNKIELASKTLVEYSEEVGCSRMVPWGDIVVDKISDFEHVVFGLTNDEHPMLRFSNICRTVAMSSENV